LKARFLYRSTDELAKGNNPDRLVPSGTTSLNVLQHLTQRKRRSSTEVHHLVMDTSLGFEELLAAAAAESKPQVLLFVFAGAEPPAEATGGQRQNLSQGGSSEFTPLMCMEQEPSELTSFDAFVSDPHEVGPPWQIVFAAGLAGRDGKRPCGTVVQKALNTMMERVRRGAVQNLLALSAEGDVLSFG